MIYKYEEVAPDQNFHGYHKTNAREDFSMPREHTSEVLQPLLTIPAVAKMLGVSRPTVYNFISKEGLPIIKLGKSVRVAPASLQSWLSERERVRQ